VKTRVRTGPPVDSEKNRRKERNGRVSKIVVVVVVFVDERGV